MSDIIAIFWDFEHLHQALMLDKHGHPGHKKANGRLQPKMVSVEAVVDYARSLGQVLTNEAFGNWHWMARYRESLLLEETVLVQVFPEDQYAPADVFSSLVTRIERFIRNNEYVTKVVLVGMDNDYVKYYLRIAAQQGVRMPLPQVMWVGIDIYSSFLRDFGQFQSFKELDDECYNQLSQDMPGATMTEVKKIRQVLFKCYLFRPSEDGQISFQENIQTLADIEDCYFELMLKRIANNLREATDYTALSLALTGTDESAARLEKMHGEINSKEDTEEQ